MEWRRGRPWVACALLIAGTMAVYVTYLAVHWDDIALGGSRLHSSTDNSLRRGTLPHQRAAVIPKIIHQSWKTADRIPQALVPWMRTWRTFHQTWTYMFWDDSDNLRLFEVHLPEFFDVAKSVSKIELADMARVALLYQYGGIYVDGDFECLRPFDDLLHHPLFFGPEPSVHAILLEGLDRPRLWNALLASRPRHPFWLAILRTIQRNFSPNATSNPLHLTGPGAFDPTYAQWTPSRANPLDNVVVLPEEVLYPEHATWRAQEMAEACARRRAAEPAVASLCDWLQDHPNGHHTPNTHAVHHWQCSWCGRGGQGKATQGDMSLDEIFTNVTRPSFHG